jgi:periplasmic protein TonB
MDQQQGISEYYESNRNKGLIISIVLHGLLLLLFYLLVAYKAPDPPLPVYGVELNLGFEESGSGTMVNTSPTEQANPEAEQAPDPSPVESQPEPETSPSEAPVATQPDPAPVSQPEKPVTETPKEKVDPEPKKPVEENKPEPKPEFKPKALFPGKDKKPPGGSEGNDPGKTGNKGKPDGTPDGTSYDGTPGKGGSGASLDLSGWAWSIKPDPKDKSDESGKIVFVIKVNEEGKVIQATVEEKTVSSEVVQLYKAEVLKSTFRKLNEQADMPAISTGRITFIIRSR